MSFSEGKTCESCGKIFFRSTQRANNWNKQKNCSARCFHDLRVKIAHSRDRICSLCKRLRSADHFGVNVARKRSKCLDCERVEYRIRYSLGLIPKRKRGAFVPQSRYKIKARNLLQAAVRRGKIIPQPCKECGIKKVDGHHPDYKKPYEVVWLCRSHHSKLHRKPIDTPLTEEAYAIRVRAMKPDGEGKK